MRSSAALKYLSLIAGVLACLPAFAGTAAAPNYTFSGNTNTGMFNPMANMVGFSTAGSERLRVDASGNVGIGTTTPQGIVDIEGGTATSGNGSNINIVGQSSLQSGNTTGGTINITSGSGFGTGRAGDINLSAARGTGSNGGYINLNAYANGIVQFDLSGSHSYSSSSGSSQTPASAFVMSSTWGGDAVVQNYTMMNGSNPVAGYFGAINAGAGTYSAPLVWGQATGASSYSERMRIDSSGNVGIGTVSPAAKLDVAGTVKLGTAGGVITGMGTCTIASTAWTTIAITGKTCTGVPAATAMVFCAPATAVTSQTFSAIATAANTVTIVASVAGTTALNCYWVQP